MNLLWGRCYCMDYWGYYATKHSRKYHGVPKLNFFCRFGSGSERIWLDDINCRGTETSLFFCPRSRFGSHNCDHSEDVAVYCAPGSAHVGESTLPEPNSHSILPESYSLLILGLFLLSMSFLLYQYSCTLACRVPSCSIRVLFCSTRVLLIMLCPIPTP